MKTESLQPESIGNGIHIYTNNRHPFGTDAILLASFAAPKKSDTALDLGSGCGIIPFLWARGDAPAHITALEIQESGIALIQKSIALNHLEERITAYNGDLRCAESFLAPLHRFSLVTMNPPYTALGSGYKSAEESQKIARHELSCTTEDLMHCAAKMLRFGGRLCICQKPERLSDLICAMRAEGIEPKRLRFVSGREGKKPYLVLLEGKVGAHAGMAVLPELCVNRADGSYSKEMLEIYGDYGDGTK